DRIKLKQEKEHAVTRYFFIIGVLVTGMPGEDGSCLSQPG
ncbi:hypothetical protein Pgy4_39860, partial [Pseudomonas savastanoi pv. glycinea str. race 4]